MLTENNHIMHVPLTHFRSVSVLKVSTAATPSVRRFPSNRNISRHARRGPFSFLPTGRIELTFSLLSERLRWVNSEREFIVSGRPFRPLPLRSRLVKAVLSPTVLGTCHCAVRDVVLARRTQATLILYWLHLCRCFGNANPLLWYSMYFFVLGALCPAPLEACCGPAVGHAGFCTLPLEGAIASGGCSSRRG